jgi:DNA-binding LytR/AlgR family response regulator
MELNCLVIDDEPLARRGLVNYIAEVPYLRLAGEAAGPVEALPMIQSLKPDLLLLDIRMPRMSGLELLANLPNAPLAILVTAFSEHALEGYDLDVVDYLVKPVPFERFLKAVGKARELHTLRNGTPLKDHPGDDHFFVKCKGCYEKVLLSELLYAEAMQNYVVLHTEDRKLVTYLTFKGVEEHLPSSRFLRIHKSYIVARNRIESIDGEQVRLAGRELPIGRSCRDAVMDQVLRNKVLKR